jgi:hypothetical protein
MTILAFVLLATQTFANATVVSTDVTHRTITVKRNNGPSEVLAVEGNTAAARLHELKPGVEVILTLRETPGAPSVVTLIKPSLRGTRPARKVTPGAAPASPTPPAPSAPPGRATGATPKVTPAPSTHPPTDTVGPQQDPRKGTQQDPRDNPNRDPRVIPGLTEPAPSAKPSPSPTPTPRP